jgi:hypothetical protein
LVGDGSVDDGSEANSLENGPLLAYQKIEFHMVCRFCVALVIVISFQQHKSLMPLRSLLAQ